MMGNTMVRVPAVILGLLTMVFGSALSPARGSEKAPDEAAYLSFFEDFQARSLAFDASLSQLYAPDANIIGIRKRADGTEESMTIDGKRWRAIILASMERARELGDRSEYSDIDVEIMSDADEPQATITATRYSALECFSDERFYAIVAANAEGQLQIVEQFMETPAASLCEKDDSKLPAFLQTTAEMINKQLPAEIDPETRLVRTSAEGSELTYHYLLINHTTASLSSDEALARMGPLVAQQSCTSPNLRPILDQDGSIAYIYRGSDGVEIVRLGVDKSACVN